MSQELEDTPTAESKAPTTELCEIGGGKLIWGRLYSTIKSLDSLGKEIRFSKSVRIEFCAQICKRTRTALVECWIAMSC